MATIYEVQAPDGSILEIEGPDQADEAQIMQAAAELYQSQQTVAPQKPVQAPQFGSMETAVEIPGLEQPYPEPQPRPTMGEYATGAAETLGTMVSGATTGLLGGVGGAIEGTARSIAGGQYKTEGFAPTAAEYAQRGMQAGTYEPRGRVAPEALKAIGEVASALPPILGVGPLGSNIPQRVRPFPGMDRDVPPTPTRVGVGEAAPTVSPTSAVAAVAPALDEEMATIGELSRKAASGSKAAIEELADKASVNPEAFESAKRLGIELPADVFSDNYQIKSAAGLTRSKAASEAEASWNATVQKAVDTADEIFSKDIGATYVEGMPSVGIVSYDVLNTLNDSMNTLKKSAVKVMKDVDERIPSPTKIQLNNLRNTLDERILEVGLSGLSSAESKLLAMLDEGSVTYGRLKLEKDLMRRAKDGKESLYGGMQEAALDKLYSALKEDQLTVVGRLLGPDFRKNLRVANRTYAKGIAIGNRIISAFGREADGSIANLMLSAIKSAGKGDSAKFTKLMKVVPQELQKEVIATALAGVARSTSNASSVKGRFGFSEFADLYRGLRANPPVYKVIAESLGKDADRILRDMYSVANRVTAARALVLSTGKANQALVGAMTAENLVSNIMKNTASKAAAHAAAAAMGPIGGGAMSIAIDALGSGNKDSLKAAGALFNSEEFKALAVAAATKPEVPKTLVKKVAASLAFKKFVANSTVPMPRGQTNLEAWIFDAMQRGVAPQDEERQ